MSQSSISRMFHSCSSHFTKQLWLNDNSKGWYVPWYKHTIMCTSISWSNITRFLKRNIFQISLVLPECKSRCDRFLRLQFLIQFFAISMRCLTIIIPHKIRMCDELNIPDTFTFLQFNSKPTKHHACKAAGSFQVIVQTSQQPPTRHIRTKFALNTSNSEMIHWRRNPDSLLNGFLW